MKKISRMLVIRGSSMSLRVALVFAGLGCVFPAILSPTMAAELTPEQARHFIAGKLFSYSCFDGTTGMGRIHADGSVIGTLQKPSGPLRFVSLPSGTIKTTSDSICSSVRGAFFPPCFHVNQTSAKSFRGSVAGFGFAYCDFVHRNPRLELARGERRAQAQPQPLHSADTAVVLRPSHE